MSSTIIVDGSVPDALIEYGIILDSIERSHESSQLLNALQDEEDKLVEFLNKSLDTIFKLNERDFESIFNLYLYLLSNIGEDLETSLVQSQITTRCLQLVDDADFKLDSTILISILTSIFNVLRQESQYRFELLSTLVEILDKTNGLKQILDINFETYYQWLSPLKTDVEIVQFLLSVIDKLSTSATVTTNTQSLELFEDVVVHLNDALTEQELNKFLIASFNNEFKLDLSSYTKLKLDRASGEFKELLVFYNAKDLSSFETFYQSNLGIFKDIDYDALKLKLQIIKLISTCYGLNKVSYDDLFEAIQIDQVDELENLIIYSIKKNFLNGKLNQFKKCLEVNHAVYLGDFNLDSWKLVQSKLNNWKTSLKEIKENIDNNKKN